MKESPSPAPELTRRQTLVLAAACGIGVANVYFPQAVSPLVADDLGASQGTAAAVVTAAQLGYTAGLFLLVPLADRVPARRLVVLLGVLCGLGLFTASAAPGVGLLIAASAVIGALAVVPQVVIPAAAGMVAPERRGAVTGTLLSGLIGGILLARTFGGTLGEWAGWRVPYAVAGTLMLALAAVLAATLPRTGPSNALEAPGYRSLLAAPLRLFRAEPELRRSCLYQAAVFAGFSAAWTCLALLVTGTTYGLGAYAVGVIALVGAASMFATPLAGRLVDRRGADRVNLVCLLGVVAAAAVLAVGAVGGPVGLAALVVGILLLDVAMQSGQVANQTRVLALRPDARARLNTAYMTCSFLGGSAGSWVGVRLYVGVGWTAVCGLVAALAGVALVRHAVAVRRRADVSASRSAQHRTPLARDRV
ncbi:MFS transporter [Yinghuangia seranimata]|uniref:MFS transporter n=1 Tax=Yinghuangia seranimata TaxID=408067 RepID=UPI00248D0633|nr:MFS transporter [Yinghuangia seranimata]MDI2129606.1 MFS transporter [Yinghuangia seranimata]